MTGYQQYISRHLAVKGGSVRIIDPPCTLEERRSSVGCYLVEDDGTVWCIYNRCRHGFAEVTPLHIPGVDDEAAAYEAAATSEGLSR